MLGSNSCCLAWTTWHDIGTVGFWIHGFFFIVLATGWLGNLKQSGHEDWSIWDLISCQKGLQFSMHSADNVLISVLLKCISCNQYWQMPYYCLFVASNLNEYFPPVYPNIFPHSNFYAIIHRCCSVCFYKLNTFTDVSPSIRIFFFFICLFLF